MYHRGPDDLGLTDNPQATLGMRRLAIFDPANGHQPMVTEDGRFSIVFNGAIYNFQELRRELETSGFSFRTQCDTEVLLKAFACWGSKSISHFRGMFAFAIWDNLEQRLTLARDPFGIKPLYYFQSGNHLLFASELNSLGKSGFCNLSPSPEAAMDYLAWLAVPAPATIYHNIYILKPAEILCWKGGQVSKSSYWDFSQLGKCHPCTSREEFVHELRERLNDTIRTHMLADVPVGAFLSGGLDSAVISGLMTKISGAHLKTFSIGFAEAEYSEEASARKTAEKICSEHHHFQLSGKQVAADIEGIVGNLDHPTGDGINTFYVSQIARQGGVTVALSGLGGDELFGSYPSFKNSPRIAAWLPYWKTLPEFLRRAMIDQIRKGDTRKRKLADFLQHAGDLHETCALQRRVLSTYDIAQYISPEIVGSELQNRFFHPHLDSLRTQMGHNSSGEIVSAWELSTYMADVLLNDSDMMSMRHSLELRVPFIDVRFIDWLWSQPDHLKFDKKFPKSPLAAAAADVIQPGLANRRKMGFMLPFAVWMKTDLRPFLEDTFSKESLSRSNFFNAAAISKKWNAFLNTDDSREWSRIWSLAILIRFVNRRAE